MLSHMPLCCSPQMGCCRLLERTSPLVSTVAPFCPPMLRLFVTIRLSSEKNLIVVAFGATYVCFIVAIFI